MLLGASVSDTEVVGLDACSTRSVDPARVAAVRSQLLDLDEASRLAEVFKLLGDPTRARLLSALLEGGELCVCDLAAVTGVPETSVSHALRLLRTAGIVRNRRAGRMVYYSLADGHVRMILDLSLEHLRHGEGR
jgi:ArsR family transcriptional regulator, lead/cadmium/zinc/bismuth-responsive transcriptional repressor